MVIDITAVCFTKVRTLYHSFLPYEFVESVKLKVFTYTNLRLSETGPRLSNYSQIRS